ncbi:MAG TPA: hypothetical protein VLE43_04790 [Candidatus Saccharimonadia bacterium]|nr:hypothetical protein [Candidatus Saccharimonadia bacterium]
MFTIIEMKGGWHHPVLTCDHCKQTIDIHNLGSVGYRKLDGPARFYHTRCTALARPKPKHWMDLDSFMVHAAHSILLNWKDHRFLEDYYDNLRGEIDGARDHLEEMAGKVHQLN